MKPYGTLVLQRRVGVGGAATFALLVLLNAWLGVADPSAVGGDLGLAFFVPLTVMGIVFAATATWRNAVTRSVQWVVLFAYGLFVQSFTEGLTGALIMGAGLLLASHYGFFAVSRGVRVVGLGVLIAISIVINSVVAGAGLPEATQLSRVLQAVVYATALIGVAYAYGLVVRETVLIASERQSQLEHEIDLATRDLQAEVASRKVAEEAAQEAAMKAATLATERLALIGEIQHRAKNSLQMTLSLLDQTDASSIESAVGRIRAIGLVYDLVDGQKNLSAIDLGQYMDQLSSFLSMSFSDRPVAVTYEGDIGIESDVDASTNTGLMIIELVELAREHAFPESSGAVAIEGERTADGLVLTISHGGAALPDRVTPLADGSVEYPMLSAFFQRLGVRASLDRDQGSRWTLRIPSGILQPSGVGLPRSPQAVLS